MVLKEVVDFMALYMCVNCMRIVYSLQLTAYLQMFVKFNIELVSANPGWDSVCM